RTVLPAFAPEIPHRCKHDIWVCGIDRHIRATGRKVPSSENLVPCFAAVSGLVEPAIGRIAPERPGHRGKAWVASLWAHCDLCNALGLFQTGMLPCFPAVG